MGYCSNECEGVAGADDKICHLLIKNNAENSAPFVRAIKREFWVIKSNK